MIRSSAEIMLSSIILQIQIPYATEEYLWSNVVHWYIIMALQMKIGLKIQLKKKYR